MANTRITSSGRRARRTASPGGLPWVSELQLDAYLQARDALRRARARASMTQPSKSPPSAS